MTLDNLQMLGMGLDSGELFKDTSCCPRRRARGSPPTSPSKIVKADPGGMKLHFPDHTSDDDSDAYDEPKIKRTLRSLLDKLLKAESFSSSKPSPPPCTSSRTNGLW